MKSRDHVKTNHMDYLLFKHAGYAPGSFWINRKIRKVYNLYNEHAGDDFERIFFTEENVGIYCNQVKLHFFRGSK